MAQTIDQLRQNLQTADYGVAYILANNAEDVADNLRSQGFIVSSADDITEALNAMLAAGNGAAFVQALSVPVRLDKISNEELGVVAQVASGMANISGKPLPKNSDGSFDVAALFGGLATGYLSYLSLTGQQQVNPQQAANQPQQPRRPDNTLTIVLGVVAVVVVIVAIVLISKGKK
jgi:hypothetical protein